MYSEATVPPANLAFCVTRMLPERFCSNFRVQDFVQSVHGHRIRLNTQHMQSCLYYNQYSNLSPANSPPSNSSTNVCGMLPAHLWVLDIYLLFYNPHETLMKISPSLQLFLIHSVPAPGWSKCTELLSEWQIYFCRALIENLGTSSLEESDFRYWCDGIICILGEWFTWLTTYICTICLRASPYLMKTLLSQRYYFESQCWTHTLCLCVFTGRVYISRVFLSFIWVHGFPHQLSSQGLSGLLCRSSYRTPRDVSQTKSWWQEKRKYIKWHWVATVLLENTPGTFKWSQL